MSGTPASCTRRRPSARAAATLTDGSRSLRDARISNATASVTGGVRTIPTAYAASRRTDGCSSASALTSAVDSSGGTDHGWSWNRATSKASAALLIERFARWLHVDTDHACEGAFADVDLGVADKAGEQRQRFGPTALAQCSQSLPSNLR